ncbi:peroxisomal multifunctional enzyme [Linnemannia elongata AG-77]|uniref:Peroxisomal multifunctional enzyme n=1 Tax=Linnemannia elongata AG-77 TaxID=1314771 RepID=A0A197K144_9FUNG|nr:peroxisomal multifunctional enzyme [Linnemannia elongata AG-77]
MSTVDLSKALGYKAPPTKVVFNTRDYLLYALSIGIHSEELHFLYENHPQFAAFPTYPLVLAFKRDNNGVSVYDGAGSDAIPGIPPFDPNTAVHGEQSLEVHRALPVEGAEGFELQSTVTGVYDKGKGMVIERTAKLVDPKDVSRPYATMMGSAFVRGSGGWGGPRGPADVAPDGRKPESLDPPKDRAPDRVYEDSTHADQAILYRLSGDYNPLHIDPEIAPMVGLERPILHGLCTFGHSAHAILKAYGGSDSRAFKSITGRFSAPVLPGDTLVTKMWNVPSSSSTTPENKGRTRIIFQTYAKERNLLVINSGCVILQDPSPQTHSKL